MAKQPNNPAGRLLRIIEQLKKIPGGTNANEAWAKVLNVDYTDTSTLLNGIGVILRLGNDITRSIEKHEVSHALYLDYVNQILRVFQKMDLGSHIGKTVGQIKEEHIVGLRFCDELLRRKAPERELNKNDLKKIHEDIMSLIDEVVKSEEVIEYLKAYLLDKLDMLRQAVEMYDISGVKPIENAINDIIGSVVTSNSQAIQNYKDSKLCKKVFRVAIFLYMTIQGINNVAQLPESIEKIIPGSKGMAAEIIEKKPIVAPISTKLVDEKDSQTEKE